jgi:hypothetical protein
LVRKVPFTRLGGQHLAGPAVRAAGAGRARRASTFTGFNKNDLPAAMHLL